MPQALCGVAAGCTKTSITSHFSLKANTADLSAKENAQETAVNVCGMVSCSVVVHYFLVDRLWVSLARGGKGAEGTEAPYVAVPSYRCGLLYVRMEHA